MDQDGSGYGSERGGRRQALVVDSYDDDYDEVCGFAVNPMHQPERERKRNRVSALHANNS